MNLINNKKFTVYQSQSNTGLCSVHNILTGGSLFDFLVEGPNDHGKVDVEAEAYGIATDVTDDEWGIHSSTRQKHDVPNEQSDSSDHANDVDNNPDENLWQT